MRIIQNDAHMSMKYSNGYLVPAGSCAISFASNTGSSAGLAIETVYNNSFGPELGMTQQNKDWAQHNSDITNACGYKNTCSNKSRFR